MHLVYDFDGTLFSARLLRDAWVAALSDFDLSSEQINKAAEPIIQIGYTLEGHARALGIEGGEVKKIIGKFSKMINEQSPFLVFDDVLAFLEANQENHQTILTYGDPDFQTQKTQASGLADIVDDIKIAGPEKSKLAHLRELVEMGSEPIAYFEDNPFELKQIRESGLPITLFRLARPNERHGDRSVPEDGDLWQCVSSFEEVEI